MTRTNTIRLSTQLQTSIPMIPTCTGPFLPLTLTPILLPTPIIRTQSHIHTSPNVPYQRIHITDGPCQEARNHAPKTAEQATT